MVTAKKWGNSIGVIIPREIIKNQHIKEGDELAISVFKKGDLRDVFGKLKTKMSGQEFKDLARKGWESQSDREFNKRLK